MRTNHIRSGFLGLALAAAAGNGAHAQSIEVENPVYVVEPCCNLCPQASNRTAYNTKFLSSFTTLVQGEDGWLFRSDDDLRTAFGPDAEGTTGLRRLSATLRRKGTELVIVLQPPRGLMHPDKLPRTTRASYNRERAGASYADTIRRLRKLGITVPDMTPLMDQSGKDPQAFFFRADHHWTPHGAQRTARLVAEAIKAMPGYAQLPKKKFITQRTGVLAKKGTMQKAVTLLCGFGYTDQYVDQYATEPVDSSTDLFGEDALPQVALVGTSNSDSAYNFAGFLSEYLSVDILNESITGGGYDSALLRYLPSEEFQKNPPKILIWEIETYHNLSNRNFYRQVLPRVHNGCAGRQPILSGQTSLRGTATEVLFNGGGRVLPLPGKRNLLDVQFSDPAVRELRATIWYTNGSHEALNIKYSDYAEAGGRFVSELRGDPDWGDRGFLSLDLSLPEGVTPGVGVKAALCERADAGPTAPATRAGKKRRGGH